MSANQQTKRMQPLVALKALKRLINDPELTDQVFVIIKAMSGNALEKSYARFRKTDTGSKILSEKRELLATLQDRDTLGTLPVGSLGQHYLKFVETEQITADGLVEASELNDAIQEEGLRLFGERMRDQHDLWHVVTGYGRDTFGEACLLAFTYAQTKNRGLGVIALAGMYKLSTEVRTAMWQAYRAGKKAAWLPAQDWEGLLSRPLTEIRTQLNIAPPVKYRQVFDQYALAS